MSASAGPYIGDQIEAAKKTGGISAGAAAMIRLLETDHLDDQLAAVAWLRKQPFVEPDRIAVAGNSFGGIEAVLGAEKGNYCAAVGSAAGAQSWAVAPELHSVMTRAVDRQILDQAITEKQVEPAEELFDLLPKPYFPVSAMVVEGVPAPWPLEPVATVVEDQRPLFRWQRVASATYSVRVYDSDFHVVATSGRISAPEWRVRTPLRRGMRYSWQLKVHTNNRFIALIVRHKRGVLTVPKSALEAPFQILGEDAESEISHARSDWGDSHLVLGVLYARAGLLKEAEIEFRALRQQNPNSDEVGGLLASVEQLREDAPCPEPHEQRGTVNGRCSCESGWTTDPTTLKCVAEAPQ